MRLQGSTLLNPAFVLRPGRLLAGDCGLAAATRWLAVEYASRGIRVTAVSLRVIQI